MAITSINLGKIKFNWRGPWSLGVTYVKDDVVRYNGSSYVVVTGHTSATSWATNSSKFDLMAEGTTPTTTEGDLIVRGASADERLEIGDPGQVLTVSTGGNPIWKDNGVLDKIYYVAPTGSDSNSGQSWGTAFATIKHACSVAVGPATIRVASGSFSEQLPITVPSFVAIVGDNQRTTIVGPASGYEQQTMWKLGDGALLNKMAFIGLTGYVPYAPDDTNIDLAAIGGVYVAFDPLVPIATKSPYVIECSAKSSGGVGALVDGSVHATGIKSMVFHGFTVILDDGVGYWVKDNGKSEIVSCFTYYCHIGYAATGGGKIRALNGNNSYGTYGALSSGYNAGESTVTGTIYGNMLTWAAGSLVSIFEEGDTITGGTSGATGTVVNVQPGTNRIYYKIATGGPFQVAETVTNGNGASMTIAASGVTGQTGVILVVTGLSAEPKAGGSISITGDTISYVVQSSSGWTNSGSIVVLVLAAEKAAYSVDGTNMKLRYDYSNIRLTGHDFLSIGTGGMASTNYPGVPTQASTQGNEVVELFPGRVFYVSTDQDGNFRVGEYFKVDQATGRATLNASAFDLSGLTSLRLGSIGAQLGALVNEFSTDDTLSGNSNVAVPTEKAVRTYFSHVATNVLPSITNSLTIGSSSYLWDKVYANKLIGPATMYIDPATEGDNTGTLVVKGNLQVDGTTTTINSTTLSIDDKNIVLADGSTLDSQADGAGITVTGATNKTLNWVDATDAWTSSEHIDLASGKAYYINGTSVLNATTLGSGVTGSSLQSVGTLSGGLNIATSQTYKINSVDVLSASVILGSAVTPTLGGNSTTGITLGGTALTSVQIGSNTTAANTVTIGGAITGNILKIAGTASGTTTLSSDVTSGTVTLWAGITTGTVNFANAITTGTINIAGGSGAAAVNIGNASGTTTVKGNLVVDSGKTFAIKGSSSGSVTFQAAAAAGSVTYTLPSADASTSGYALVSNGSGTLSWAAAGASITDDTSTTTLYPVFSTATSGSLTAAKVSSTKFSFNASTGKGTITALIVGDNTTSSGALVVGSANSYAGGLVLGKPSTYSGYISATDNLYMRAYASGGTGNGSVTIENASGTAQFTMNTSTGNFTAVNTVTTGSSTTGGIRVHTNSGITASNNFMNFFTSQTTGWSFNANGTGADTDSKFTISLTGVVVASGTITSNSDASLKTNVATITNALDKVVALRGVMFDRISTGAREMGVIAQEVELVVPELVFTDDNGIKSVAYANTVALLIEAIKEQQVQINELKGKQ